jgi:hypothetical protein
MRFDGMDTMEGRHLVFAYAAVLLIQGGYLAWVVRNWLGLRSEEAASSTKKGERS